MSRKYLTHATAFDDDEDDDDVNEAAYDEEADAAELAEAGEFYDVDELELGEEDERALDLLMGGGAPQRTLADVIMEKINERNAALAGDGHAGRCGRCGPSWGAPTEGHRSVHFSRKAVEHM